MGIRKNLKEAVQQSAINLTSNLVTSFVRLSPEKNFDRMMRTLKFLAGSFGNPKPFNGFMNWLNRNPGTRQWFINLMLKDKGQASNVIKILFGNCSLKWIEKSKELQARHGFTSPYSILISPTMCCNLKCKGCYANGYSMEDDMPIDTVDSIITQGKELGTYFYTILGGEPFVRFDIIEKMAEKHKDCIFQVFTNGTLIKEKTADRIAELKNIIVVFSVNGDKDEVDFMRGKGVYEKVVASVERLKRRNLMMGMSMVLTSRNFDLMTSTEFYNEWESRGIMFAWNFLFMPVSKNADLSLMPTPEQRVEYGEFIKEYREQNPLFIMDFWADAPAVHGCAAGGRRYLHINNKGDVEPCIFAHFATHNVHRHSLLEALKSPFFTAIRQHQPHTDNLLRPCMIIDNPDVLRSICKKHNARPTDEGARDLIENPDVMNHIDEYARNVAPVVDKVWNEKYAHNISDILNRCVSYPEGLDRISYRLDRISYMERIIEISGHDQTNAATVLEEASHAHEKYGTDVDIHTRLGESAEYEFSDLDYNSASLQQ
jgi:MoaA/NifB/PqqE/SkfB family radical SAM enzyme